MAPQAGGRSTSLVSLSKIGSKEGLGNDLNENIKGSLLSVPDIEAEDDEIPRIASLRMTWKVKVVHTILVFSAFLGFGFCRGIYGPTLLELRRITGVTLAQISMLFTCLGVGGIAGSLTFGRLFDKFNPLFLFVGAVSSLASITAVIPWLKKLVLMIVACAAHSFVYSGLAIGCNVTLFRLWRDKSRPIFLSMHLLYTVGGFIAPLLSEPFLTPKSTVGPACHKNNTERSPISSSHQITSSAYLAEGGPYMNKLNTSDDRIVTSVLGESLPNLTADNNGQRNAESLHNKSLEGLEVFNYSSIIEPKGKTYGYEEPESRIFITYLILSLYLLTVAISIFILMMYMRNINTGEYWKDNQPSRDPPCSGGTSLYRLLATILFMVFNTHIGGQETLYTGLLFTYAVEHVGFSQTQGSLLVSIFFTAYAAGRFCSIFIGHWVQNALYVLLFNLAGASIASFTLAYFTTTNITILWVCTVIEGLSLSTMYTMGLLWAKDFLPITASFTSLYTIAFTCGMMIWPPLTSSLMKRLGPAWFAYMNVLLVICCATAMIFLGILHRLRYRFKNLSPSEDREVQVRFQSKMDILAQSVHSVNTM